MAWEGSTRRQRLPNNWPQLRHATRTRAGGQCEATTTRGRCPNQGTECDHVVRGDDHSMTNLAWLCTPHHAEKSGREGAAARSTRHPSEPHPGLLR